MIVHGEGQRYVVSELSGFDVLTHGTRGNHSVGLAVLDSHDCYRPVATIGSRTAQGHGRAYVKRRRMAVRECDRLNYADAVTEPPAPDFDYYAELAALQRKRVDAIVWLHEHDGLSIAAIAERLKITPQRVNQLLREARA